MGVLKYKMTPAAKQAWEEANYEMIEGYYNEKCNVDMIISKKIKDENPNKEFVVGEKITTGWISTFFGSHVEEETIRDIKSNFSAIRYSGKRNTHLGGGGLTGDKDMVCLLTTAEEAEKIRRAGHTDSRNDYFQKEVVKAALQGTGKKLTAGTGLGGSNLEFDNEFKLKKPKLRSGPIPRRKNNE